MFISLHSNGNPIYVNVNHIIFYREPLDDEKKIYTKIYGEFHSIVTSVSGTYYVMEHVEDINKLIKPFGVYALKDAPVAEDKVPLDTPLNELGFSKRAENILGKLGVLTLADINDALDPTKHKFVRGLGSVTYTEIIQKYHACGYEFTWMNRTRQSAENGE